MAYTHTTRLSARTQLAGLLHDTGNVYWASGELDYYLDEALRTWGVAARYWREKGTLSTTAGTAFYDLTSSVTPSALRTQIVTDTDLALTIQYHLLETSQISPYLGTEQFTLAQITSALQRRRDQFLVETGSHLTLSTVAVGADPAGRKVLADTVIDVRRAAWLDSDSRFTPLWRSDEHAANSFNPEWLQNPLTPQSFSVSTSPPLSIQLIPPPLSSGTLDLITVSSGAVLDPAATVVLGVPDDFTWVVKFGALADLLGKDGQAYDPARSAYCEQRWQEGIQLASITTSVVDCQIANIPKPITSLHATESFNGNWQNEQGTPEKCFLAGLNIIGFHKVPSSVISISLDMQRNAPIPSGDAGFLEVGREELEAILLYAQHLASFKMSGQEFAATRKHYEHFWRLASLRNSRLAAAARNFKVLNDKAELEEQRRPRTMEVA